MQILNRSLALRHDARHFSRSAIQAGLLLALIWAVYLCGEAIGLRVYEWGVRPRQAIGLAGIVTAPLMHGSFEHLVSNSLPFLLLFGAMRYMYPVASMVALPLLWVGSGLAVWLVGRDSSHVGASGVIYGMLLYVFVAGMLRSDVRSLALAMIVFFLYGGMLWGMLPGERGVSFESHIAGALVGVLLALVLRKIDPPVLPKRYGFEIEEQLEREARERGEAWPEPLDGLWRDKPEEREPLPLLSWAHLKALLRRFRQRG